VEEEERQMKVKRERVLVWKCGHIDIFEPDKDAFALGCLLATCTSCNGNYLTEVEKWRKKNDK
jgi:hypothetical protein